MKRKTLDQILDQSLDIDGSDAANLARGIVADVDAMLSNRGDAERLRTSAERVSRCAKKLRTWGNRVLYSLDH